MNNSICCDLIKLRKKIIEKEFCKMNKMQRQAVFQVKGPLLILAGAGSGKTTVLVNRIANMLTYGNAYHSIEYSIKPNEDDLNELNHYLKSESKLNPIIKDKLSTDKVMPWEVLAITFTNKAAGELKERLSNLLGDKANDIWASTFHSTCARILRMHADKLGYTNHFTIYDTEDSKKLIKECQKTLNIDDKFISIKSIMAEISHAKDNIISPDEYKKNSNNDVRLVKISEVYSMYQRNLFGSDAMDFDDLLFNTVKLFNSFPEILEYYQNKFKYILVDEYQDTNHVQYEFIKLLSEKHKNLCVVGDDDQSIYKFRGATIENIMNFEKTYPDAKVIRLEQNYRSTQNILSAANSVISNNSNRKGKTLWTENGEGEKISIHTSTSEYDESKYISNIILDEVANGRNYSDFCILYRMNSQSNTLEKTFVKSGIPYRIIGGFRFYERKEVKDLIAYLSVINNPMDEVRMRRIINYPKRAIGEKTVNQVFDIAYKHNLPLLEALKSAGQFEDLKRSTSKLIDFSNLITHLIEFSKNYSLSELYQEILDKTGYINALKAEKEESENRIENIFELKSNIIKYEEENKENATLSGFLEEVSLMTDIDNYDSSSDAVVMMTMHSAKGLEFPYVFLPGFEEGIFPGTQVIFNPNEIEEERRLAYVAITRAKEKLYITNADVRMLFGNTSRNKQSRFVAEIPEELIVKSRTKDWKKPEPGTVISKSSYEARLKSTKSALHFGLGVKPVATNMQVFSVGDIVSHKTFGKGTVLSVKAMGNDNLLEINFNDIGNKKLMSNFAKLEKV